MTTHYMYFAKEADHNDKPNVTDVLQIYETGITMATVNASTLRLARKNLQHQPVNNPPEDHDIEVILRVLVAMSDDDAAKVHEGESYETLVRRLVSYRENLAELAAYAKEVIGYDR